MYTVIRKDGRNVNLTNMQMHFNYIHDHYNFHFHSTNGSGFGLQLFDKQDFANDQVECESEFHGYSISNVLNQAIMWINQQVDY